MKDHQTLPAVRYSAAAAIALTFAFASGPVARAGDHTQGNTQQQQQQQQQRGIVAPQITNVTPASVAASTKAVVLTITATGLTDGTSLIVTPPGNARPTVVFGADIQRRRDGVIDATVILANPGEHTLVLKNQDGATSDPYTINVGPVAAAAPIIERISPSAITRNPAPQMITIIGTRFAPGLTVTVTSPAGTSTTLGGSAIGTPTATQFTLSILFDKPGDYTFIVNNPPGQASNAVVLNIT